MRIKNYRRYRTLGNIIEQTEDDLEKAIRAHALVPIDVEKQSADDVSYGWCSAMDVKDLDLTGRNLYVDDVLVLGMRTDKINIPPEQIAAVLKRRVAQIQAERNEPLSRSGLRDLRELIHMDLRRQAPIKTSVKLLAWQRDKGRVFLTGVGSASEKLFMSLFPRTFNVPVDMDGPGAIARDAGLTKLEPTRSLHAGFRGVRPDVLAGNDAPTSPEFFGFLGIEFLTWFLFCAANLPDGEKLKFESAGFAVFVGSSCAMRSSVDGDELSISAGLGKSVAYSLDACYAIAGGRAVRKLDLIFERGSRSLSATVAANLDVIDIDLPSLLGKDEQDDEEQEVGEQVNLLLDLDSMILHLFNHFLKIRSDESAWMREVIAMAGWVNGATRSEK